MTVKSILSVDDLGDSVSLIRGALKRHGVGLEEVGTLPEAEAMLSEIAFDFIIADARLVVDGELDYAAGPRLLKRLRDGDLGSLNRDTWCMILTSYPDEVVSQGFSITKYRGFLAKNDLTPEILGEFIGVDLSDRDEAGPNEVLERQELRVDVAFDPEDPMAAFSYTMLDGTRTVLRIPIKKLPPDIRFLFRHKPRPLQVYAKLNVAAQEPRDLRPRDFEVAVTDWN